MEHSIDVASPWRTRALAAAAIAVLELLALLGVGLAFLGSSVSTHVTRAAEARALAPLAPTRTTPRKAVATAPRLTREETSVLVLNGNGATGAAHVEAESIRRFGYVIGGVANAPRRDYTRTVVMYRKGYRPEAVRLARDRHVRLVTPLDGLKPAELMGAHLALVIGA